MKLGIDIGGTTIWMGLVDKGQVVKKICVPSFPEHASLEETLLYLEDRIEAFLEPGIEQIGVGVPSVTDPVKGIVYNAANIPSWDEVHLKERLEARFGIPVFVNNDANCYALGAALLVSQPSNVLVGVTLGTGTGVGIVHEGKLFCGTHCGAGEVGALAYEGSIYEAYCSKQFFENRGLNSKEVALAAEKGDPEAVAVYREFGRHIGEFLTVVMYAYDPDSIVFGGGVAHSYPLFKESMWETLRRRFPYETILENLSIDVMADEDVALVGAASL